MAAYDVEVVDSVEYLRHGDAPLVAKIFKPKGSGPFPIMLDIHGGAWVMGKREDGDGANMALAKKGVIVAALEFRNKEPYPKSLQDIHYAVRWAKTQAASWNGAPNRVGVMGNSSGAHQAMLLGMRPNDSRYSALPSPPGWGEMTGVGAAVHGAPDCVIMVSPVIDPLGRYNYAQGLREDIKPPPAFAKNAAGVKKMHDRYWGSEEAQAEGAPARILARGEKTALPPTLTLRFRQEDGHPRPDFEEFVSQYRKAGGEINVTIFEGTYDPIWLGTPKFAKATEQAVEEMATFAKKHLVANDLLEAKPSPTTELRIYTINEGKMADFTHFWKNVVLPTHEKYGIRIHAAFENKEKNEFVWIRSYDTKEQFDAYMNSKERAAYATALPGYTPKELVHHIEVREHMDLLVGPAAGQLPTARL